MEKSNNFNNNKIEKKEIDDNLKIDFNEYLETSLDDMNYGDALKKDKRKFCNRFCEIIKDKQIIANTFIAKDLLKPKTIKIMLFDLNIILYFVINGLFYNEDYISEVYHLEKDNFFAFLLRSIERIIYTTIVSLVINIIIECFIIDENKLKRIFIREKGNEITLRYEVTELIKKISKRFLSLIILFFIFYIIFLYYLLCFNYVYPNMQIEWIKSSIIIIIIMQLISILSILLETILRYMSFYCKSEKIYKMSKLLN